MYDDDFIQMIREIVRAELSLTVVEKLADKMLYDDKPMQNTAMIDGEEVFYHCRSEERDVEMYEQFQYIGYGTIHKIRGFRRTFEELHHFWNNKPAEWNPLDDFKVSEEGENK